MTNSWSLLYDELNMSNQDFWIDDGISLTGDPDLLTPLILSMGVTPDCFWSGYMVP